MQSKIYVDNEGNLCGLADDLIDKLYHMGEKKVERVSDVEFDHAQQCWTAKDLGGKIIAEGKIRSEVIAAEREHFNKLIEAVFDAAVSV